MVSNSKHSTHRMTLIPSTEVLAMQRSSGMTDMFRLPMEEKNGFNGVSTLLECQFPEEAEDLQDSQALTLKLKEHVSHSEETLLQQ